MKEILNYIEDKNILIDDNWYYHASRPFSKDKYINILKNGILSPYLLLNDNNLYKYVFVSRADKGNKCSAFIDYSIFPNFIINSYIPAIKAEDNFIKKLFYGGFNGLSFTSLYDDEYQVYKKIEPQAIIGILYNFDKLVTTYSKESSYYLNVLFDLVTLLNELELTIPIIDYYTKKEINKQKVLSLSKDNNYKKMK